MIRMTAAAYESLIEAATQAAPNECCGVLEERSGVVVTVIPVTNVASDRSTRYELDPAELVAAMATVRKEGSKIAGYYHSHPRTSPEPSSYDVANAWYPESVYVVIGLEPRPLVRAYRILEGHSVALELLVEPA